MFALWLDFLDAKLLQLFSNDKSWNVNFPSQDFLFRQAQNLLSSFSVLIEYHIPSVLGQRLGQPFSAFSPKFSAKSPNFQRKIS